MQLLHKIRAEAHRDLLAARSMLRAVENMEFEEALNKSNEEERKYLDAILKSRDVEGVRNWIRARTRTALEDMQYIDIRELAMKEQIPKYSRMTRDELVVALGALYANRMGQRGRTVG